VKGLAAVILNADSVLSQRYALLNKYTKDNNTSRYLDAHEKGSVNRLDRSVNPD
jgi:hypothetical protein